MFAYTSVQLIKRFPFSFLLGSTDLLGIMMSFVAFSVVKLVLKKLHRKRCWQKQGVIMLKQLNIMMR